MTPDSDMERLRHLLTLEPSEEVWEQICDELDDTGDQDTLKAKVALCTEGLEAWPDGLRNCPWSGRMEWYDLKNQICKLLDYHSGFVLKLALEDMAEKEGKGIGFKPDHLVFRKMHYHQKTGQLYVYVSAQPPLKDPVSRYASPRPPLKDPSNPRWADLVIRVPRPAPSPANPTTPEVFALVPLPDDWGGTKCDFLHVCDDDKVVLAMKDRFNRRVGDMRVMIFQDGEVIFERHLAGGSKAEYHDSPDHYYIDSVFKVSTDSRFLFGYSAKGGLLRLDLDSLELLTTPYIERIVVDMALHDGMVLLFNYNDEFVVFDHALNRVDTPCQWSQGSIMAFEYIGVLARDLFGAPAPPDCIGSFALWGIGEEGNGLRLKCFHHISYWKAYEWYPDFAFDVVAMGDGRYRVAYMGPHPACSVTVVEFPSMRQATVEIGALDLRENQICFWEGGEEILFTYIGMIGRWRFTLR